MKKNNFIAMVLGTISGVLFALGMCMVLIPEWNMFRPGILLGSAGLLLALATLLIWRNFRKNHSYKPYRNSRRADLRNRHVLLYGMEQDGRRNHHRPYRTCHSAFFNTFNQRN